MLKQLEIGLRKFALKLFLLVFSPKNPPAAPLPKGARVLLIRLNRIGDALVTTPLIAELAAAGYAVSVLADAKNAMAYAGNNNIANLIVFNKRLPSAFRLIRRLNAMRFAAVADLHDDVSTTVSLLVAFLSAPRKFALRKQNASLFTETVPKPDAASVHVVDRLLALLPLFGIAAPSAPVNIRFTPSPAEVTAAEKFVGGLRAGGQLVLGINISAGSMARFWGVSNFQRLLQWLCAYPVTPFIITASRDKDLATQIAAGSTPVFCSPSFGEFAAVVMACGLFFTPDTAAVHLASAAKVPVFGLYVQYQTNDMIWSPYASPFSCAVTREPNLNAILFEDALNHFKPFLEQYV